MSDSPNGAKHPASRLDAGLAHQAHRAALELQEASRRAEEQDRASRHRSRRRAWLLVAVLLLAAAVTTAAYGWMLYS